MKDFVIASKLRKQKYCNYRARELQRVKFIRTKIVKPKPVSRYFLMNATKEDAISYLKKMSEMVVSQYQDMSERREQFNIDKHLIFDLFKDKKCSACKVNKINHIHHAIMMKNGGSNNLSNLVPLCRSCHSEIHAWMKAA